MLSLDKCLRYECDCDCACVCDGEGSGVALRLFFEGIFLDNVNKAWNQSLVGF
jgi:hypothetical protein